MLTPNAAMFDVYIVLHKVRFEQFSQLNVSRNVEEIMKDVFSNGHIMCTNKLLNVQNSSGNEWVFSVNFEWVFK